MMTLSEFLEMQSLGGGREFPESWSTGSQQEFFEEDQGAELAKGTDA